MTIDERRSMSKQWAPGCDNCGQDLPVKYVPPLGFLCEECRKNPPKLDWGNL
jgi:hypothetical protein